MKNILFPLILAASLSSAYALPNSPLATEYTVIGSETRENSAYVINSGGVLNIGDNSMGEGNLQINYNANSTFLSGAGTINIGTDTVAGTLSVTNTNSSLKTESYSVQINLSGFVTVAKKGVFNIDGYIQSSYGAFVKI